MRSVNVANEISPRQGWMRHQTLLKLLKFEFQRILALDQFVQGEQAAW